MMQFFDLFGRSHEDETSPEVLMFQAIADALHPEMEVFPLRDIPVECDERIHDGVNPCGDTECYCAVYGYGVPSLD